MSSSEAIQGDVDVHDVPERHRYVIEVGGDVAGFAVYHQRADRYIFVHTEIHPEFEGRGLGSKLARAALDDVAAKDGTIVPLCPFIASWIERHSEYRTLIDADLYEQLSPTDR